MNPTAAEVDAARQRASAVEDYLGAMSKLYRWKFLERKESYQTEADALGALRQRAAGFFVLAFSAQWCADCAKNIPVLALISEATGLEVRVFGGIKTAPLSRDTRWAIPPSPPEVLSFGVEKLPWIVLYDRQSREIGKIIENPTHTASIEEELLHLLRAGG